MSTEILERGQQIVEKVEKFGVPAVPYKKGPDGPDIFSVALTRGKVWVWPGRAEVDIKGSSAKRQVVLNITENKRVVKHTVNISQNGRRAGIYDESTSNLKKVTKGTVFACTSFLEDRFRRAFPVTFPDPDRVKWKIGEITVREDLEYVDRYTHIDLTAEVTAIVPASKQALLVGYDEEDLFVSMLPKQAKSVADAHKLLIPKGVDNRAVRQGEWFFQPVSEKLSEELDNQVAQDPNILGTPEDLSYEYPGDQVASRSDHYATVIHHKNKLYAIGFVTDHRHKNRRGTKKPHHQPLFLCDWHEVIRNNEIQVEQVTQRPGSRRRRQTWD